MGEFRIGARLVGDREVVQRLATVAAGGKRMRPLMKRIGELIILPSIRKTLETDGRGLWPPEKRPVRKHRMLGAEGKIAKGLKVVAGDRAVRVGTTSGFGPWAQEGFTAHIPAERPKRGKLMRLLTDDGPVFATRVRPHTITVPKRAFLMLQEEDRVGILQAAADFLHRLVRRGAIPDA